MILEHIFKESLSNPKELSRLYREISLTKTRVRSEWRKKIFSNKIVSWGTRSGIWRLSGDGIVVLGNDQSRTKSEVFSNSFNNLVQQSVLVLTLAAVDKLLHESVLKKFSSLLRDGILDDYVKRISLADAYQIAIESRKRTGKGGKTKRRPANLFKAKLSDQLYERSFLAASSLKELCKHLGVKNVFNKYASQKGGRRKGKSYEKEWSEIYKLRNDIVHESLIIRKQKAKKVDVRSVSSKKLLQYIDFVEDLGFFLAKKL